MKNMTIKQLRYVEAAGRHRSIAAASAECNISQSSITAAIDALEQEVGFDLFLRTPAKGLDTTPAGREAISLITTLLQYSKIFETDIKSICGRVNGAVHIACFATAATMFLPPILKLFAREFPEIEVTMIEGNMEEVIAHLDEGRADLAFTYKELRAVDHSFTPLFGAPPFALVPSCRTIAEQEDVSLAELSCLPMVLLDMPRTASYYTDMFTNRGLSVDVVHRTTSAEMIRALVASDFGFSILNIRPPEPAEHKMGYVLLPIRDDLGERVFGIMTHSDVRHPKVTEAFTKACEEFSKSHDFSHMVLRQRHPAIRPQLDECLR